MTGHPPVFVHGNPESAAIWGPLAHALDRPVVRLSPPGFGSPLPPDFPATMQAYRDWLIDELTAIGEPVDLVGHDWGALHVVNVAMARPDLLRSWASDTIGTFDPDYTWHDLARGWQTPGAGEADVEARFSADLQTRTAALVELGFPADVAREVATAQDGDMGRAVLALYRSAAQPVMATAGRQLERAAATPGLFLLATDDDLSGTTAVRTRAARRAGAQIDTLEGRGHWWMLQDPAGAAQRLRGFWDSRSPRT